MLILAHFRLPLMRALSRVKHLFKKKVGLALLQLLGEFLLSVAQIKNIKPQALNLLKNSLD